MPGFTPTNLRSLVEPLGGLLGRLDRRTVRYLQLSEVSLVLLSLMQDMQLHRGLSCTVLDGRVDFVRELDAVGGKLQRALHTLEDQYGSRHAVFARGEWQALRDRWEALYRNWRDLDFFTNLNAHSELVLGVVEILRLFAEEHAALLGTQRVAVIRAWPPMVEHLGMLRALGLYSLAATDDLADQRHQAAMTSHYHAACRTLSAAARCEADDLVVSESEAMLHAVEAMLQDAQQRSDAQAYFHHMTAVIDAWYASIRSRLLI